MRKVIIRDLVLGDYPPKICIPLMGKDPVRLSEAARLSLDLSADLYELRADCLEEPAKESEIADALSRVRYQIKDSPLIFTFRSDSEGGMGSLTDEAYIRMCRGVIGTGLADILDVELSRGKEAIKSIISEAHEKGIFVLMSRHEYQESLSKEELLSIFRKMQEFDADITKLAVMARSAADMLTIFQASLAMKEEYADRPFIAIAMGQKGVLSRIGGGFFGSVLTYAEGLEVSAPGQLKAPDVRLMFDLLYK